MMESLNRMKNRQCCCRITKKMVLNWHSGAGCRKIAGESEKPS
jgi:hypothetical protein